jgi:ribosomal protein S18
MRRNQKRENTSELAKLRHYDYKNYDILKKNKANSSQRIKTMIS